MRLGRRRPDVELGRPNQLVDRVTAIEEALTVTTVEGETYLVRVAEQLGFLGDQIEGLKDVLGGLPSKLMVDTNTVVNRVNKKLHEAVELMKVLELERGDLAKHREKIERIYEALSSFSNGSKP